MTTATLVSNAFTGSSNTPTTLLVSTAGNTAPGDWTYLIVWADDPGTARPWVQFYDGSVAEIEVVMPYSASPTTPSMSMVIWRYQQLPGQKHAVAIYWATPVINRMVIINVRNGTRVLSRVMTMLNHNSPPTGNQAATAPGVTLHATGSSLVIAVMADRLSASIPAGPYAFQAPYNTARWLGAVPAGASAFPGAFGCYENVASGTKTNDVVYAVVGSPYAGLRVGTAMGLQLAIPSIDDDPLPPAEPGYDNKVSVGDWFATDGPVPEIDPEGNVWVMQNLEGWFGGIDVRPASIDRPMADGVFDGPAPFAGRMVTVTGTLMSPSRDALQQAFDKLAGVLSGAERIGLLRVDERVRSVIRRASVRLGGSILLQRTGGTTAEFSVPFFAPDPNRYSDDLTSVTWTTGRASGGRTYDLSFPRRYGTAGETGFVTVTNNGNRITWPIFTIVGPATNPMIRVQGGPMLKINGNLASSSARLVIDTKNRLVSYNGTYDRTLLSADSEWFSLPPGESVLYFLTDVPNQTGKATVEFRDAYS